MSILRINDNKKEWNSIHLEHGGDVIAASVVTSQYERVKIGDWS